MFITLYRKAQHYFIILAHFQLNTETQKKKKKAVV